MVPSGRSGTRRGQGDQLARNIALRNPELNIRELNCAVTMTIDCTTFLRMWNRGLIVQAAWAAKTPTYKTAIQRQFDATDRQIDELVYELYDLTDEEIRIVEEASAAM